MTQVSGNSIISGHITCYDNDGVGGATNPNTGTDQDQSNGDEATDRDT